MSTQPSEHAQRASKALDGGDIEAHIIDTHAIEPATRELREALARIYWLRKSQLRDADEGLQLCREIAARALSENEEKK